jgi:hypothetical protein
MKFKLFLSSLLICSLNSFALIDYSETSSNKSASMDRNQSSVELKKSSDSSSSLIWKSNLNLETNYEIGQIDNDKSGIVNIVTHIQTPMNVFLDFKYWQANLNNKSLSGNPFINLGFNWMRIGSGRDEALINIGAGLRLAGTSELASSRQDKVFTFETTKKFDMIGLGLSYEYTLTGIPKKSSDMTIGNIHKIEVSAGWIVSNDIQFEVSAENFRVTSSNGDQVYKLDREFSFSTLSPKMDLQIFRSVNFELGARFQMQKAKTNSDLKAMKLVDLHGLYSNSIFSGLNFSI